MAASVSARAAGPLPADGEVILTSDYRIDMYQGPILGSSRSTGLAGSTAALAEGVDGMPVNAAAPAVRSPWSVNHYDYDLGIGFTTASSLEDSDFDNNGRVRFEDGTIRGGTPYERFLFLTLGGAFQWGRWGVGLNIDTQSYRLGETPTVPGAPPNLEVALGRVHLLVARTFWDRELTVGLGFRGANLAMTATENVDGSGEKVRLLEMSGAGLEAGFVHAPFEQMRWGLTWRSAVQGTTKEGSRATITAEGDSVIGARYLPSKVVLPWEVEAGVAYQFGPRPLNLRFIDPHEEIARRKQRILADLPHPHHPDYPARKAEADKHIASLEQSVHESLKNRYAKLSRQKLLLSASILISGPVEDGVGVESFLRQRAERSGRWLTLQPRLGLELEPIQNHLQLRAGTYVEPSRFDRSIVRVHGTAGFDLRVLSWSVFHIFDDDTSWRVGGVVDGADRYLSIGVTAGLWH